MGLPRMERSKEIVTKNMYNFVLFLILLLVYLILPQRQKLPLQIQPGIDKHPVLFFFLSIPTVIITQLSPECS